MSLRLGDTAPDFEQDSTDGRIKFHDWIGNSWAILFSHPKDFTPVCTTELGEVARLKPEFDKRNTKVIGLSVDGLKEHQGWVGDIKETQGHALNFPLLADTDRSVGKAYGTIGGGGLLSAAKAIVGMSDRVTFIIDEKGKIAHVIDSPNTKNHAEEVLSLL